MILLIVVGMEFNEQPLLVIITGGDTVTVPVRFMFDIIAHESYPIFH